MTLKLWMNLVHINLFGSIVKSKYIERNTYTCIRSNVFSKQVSIYVIFYITNFKFFYYKRIFNCLPDSAYTRLIKCLSRKVTYDSIVDYPVISGFGTNLKMKLFAHFVKSIITFWWKGFCLGFSITSYVDSLDRFGKLVIEKANNFIYNLKKNTAVKNIRIKIGKWIRS